MLAISCEFVQYYGTTFGREHILEKMKLVEKAVYKALLSLMEEY